MIRGPTSLLGVIHLLSEFQKHLQKKSPAFLNIQVGSTEVRKCPSPISTTEEEGNILQYLIQSDLLESMWKTFEQLTFSDYY